jgi:hypothetical protein
MTIMMRRESSTKTSLSVRLWLPMSYFVSLKIVRLLAAVAVSMWLAGGCLFGCTNTAMAADVASEANQHESCHAKPHHAKQRKINVRFNETFAGVSSVPRGSITECPLMISATAAVSKSSSNSPDLLGATAAVVSLPVTASQLTQKQIVDPFMPNRGPTYLRCCVLLI